MRKNNKSSYKTIFELKPLKIGIIGCGRVVERIYLPAINNFHNIKVTAAIDPIEERRNLVSRKFVECITYKSLDENLIEQVDAAIITTPPDTHIGLASEFLKKNKYVLVEKPLALSMDGLKELREIESSSRAFLMMGFNHRYWMPVGKLKEKISGNNKIDFAEMVFTSDYSKWNPVSFISDPLDDLGPHVFDLIRFLFNKEIVSVSGNSDEKMLQLKIKLDENFIIHCQLAHCDQTIRSIKVNGVAEKFFITFKSVRINPSAGIIRNFLDINDRIKIKLLQKTFPFNNSYEMQLKKFFDFIRLGEAANPGIEDGISAMLAVEAARHSLKNRGKEIFINEIKS